MAQVRERSDHPQPAQRGIVLRSLGGIFRLAGWLLLALVFSILTEWVGLTFFWQDQGVAHCHRMLEHEVSYLQSGYRPHPLVHDPARFAAGWAESARRLFDKTGLPDWADRVADSGGGRLGAWTGRLYRLVEPYLWSAWYIVQVFAVRLAVLTLALPAFALAGMAAVSDGLVQRDLRKYGGGRESAFVYHHAKRLIGPSLILPWIVYLALPVSVHPNFVVLPFAALFGISVAVAASMFKKYL